MTYTVRANRVFDSELDMKRDAIHHGSRLGRLRVIFRRIPGFSRELVAPRRAVDREIEELFHTFD
jgi:hypothetical protein